MLVKSLTFPDTNNDTQRNLQYHTQKIDLPVEFRLYCKKRNTLTNTDIALINESVQDRIEETLYNYLHLYHVLGGMLLKNAILNFRQQYGFPEESYSSEAITKFWQRERERRKKDVNKFTTTVFLPQISTQKTHDFSETRA